MIRFTSALAWGLATIALPLAGVGQIAHAFGGSNIVQTVALHRQDCTTTAAGPVLGTAGFSLDDQGGGNANPDGLEIHTSLTAGSPRTAYSVSVVGSACQVLVTGGTLTTDDRGRGDLDFHVLGSVVPPGTSVRIQLLAPADGITSDLSSAP
jgi:hypothetical protein